jgi:hypothetical protein
LATANSAEVCSLVSIQAKCPTGNVGRLELALDYIEKGKKRLLEEYEAEFGPFPHSTAG